MCSRTRRDTRWQHTWWPGTVPSPLRSSRARDGPAGKRLPKGRAGQDADPHVTPSRAHHHLQLPERQKLSALLLFRSVTFFWGVKRLKAGALCKQEGSCTPRSAKQSPPASPACQQSTLRPGTAAWPLPTARRCHRRLRVSAEVQHPPADTRAKPRQSRCQAPRTAAPRAAAGISAGQTQGKFQGQEGEKTTASQPCETTGLPSNREIRCGIGSRASP